MRLPTVVLMAIVHAACASGPSTDEAFGLLAASPLFQSTYGASLEFGEHCDGVAVSASSPEAFLLETHADYALLAENGLVRASTPFVVHPSWWWQDPPGICVRALKRITRDTNQTGAVQRTYYYWTATLTDDGRRAGIPEAGGDVPIASKELVQITEIGRSEDASIEVRYRWRWAPEGVGEAAPALVQWLTKESGTSFGTARMQQHDDGWRVVAVADASRNVTDRRVSPGVGVARP